MNTRLPLVIAVVFVASSASFGLTFYVGQTNSTGHVGPATNTSSQAAGGSPQPGVCLWGHQTATSSGLKGIGTATQFHWVRGGQWTSPVHQTQKIINGGMQQSMAQESGLSVTTGSQSGHVLMTQSGLFGCHGKSSQHTSATAIQAGILINNPCAAGALASVIGAVTEQTQYNWLSGN